MKQLATFTGAGWDIDDAGGTGKVWRIYDGYTTPLLRGFMTTLNASPDYDGSGAAMTNIAAHTITGAYEPGLVLGAAGSTLTLASTAANAYTASVKGLYSTQQCYDLVLHRSVSTPGSVSGDIALTNPISWSSGTLAINATGTVTPVAISGTGMAIFDLQAGTWSQVNATLPGFSVYDFRISAGTFIRALSGDGTMIPYLLADSYGMQGMGSSGMLGLNYQLANDIEAGGTANWNAGAGFKPVGTDAGSQFTGSFDGQGHTISGLAINRAGTSYVGLFGYAGDASTLSHVGLLNSSISGQSSVGTLAGFSRGAISYSYADGGSATGGRNAVGGLVGGGASSIDNSYANVAVSGTSDGALSTGIGGLAGVAKNISNSYATGNVSGNLLVGGLAGQSSGAVSNSYATGAVSGNSGGGLIGEVFGGSVTDSYWDKVTTGRATSAGSAASDGKTTAEMKSLATFAAWDVDDAGGSGKMWRIYDGLGYPLLRNFFTATLTATADSGGKTYDGSTATSLSVTYSTAPNAHLLGTASVVAASAAVGTQATRVVGLYSDQTGYDIAFANGSLTVAAPPAPDPAPPAPTLIVAAPGSTTTLTGTTPVTASPGSTIVIPAGANVVGVAITLAGASDGGAAGPITFKIGSLVLTLNGYTPGTVVSFKKVLVNGVETLVLVVTSGSLTLSGSAGQPLLTLNGTATLTAGTDGTAISFSAGTDGSGSIAVTSGHIVLSMDAFALKKATRAAAPADGKIYAGELASFGADGKITAVRLGSPPGETGGAGDALTLDLAPNLSFAASVPKLDASVARLGMSVQEAMARAAGATLVGTQTNGVVVLEIGGIRIHALPLGAVAIDPDATDGVKLGADGTATVSVQGVVARFAPSVAELGNLAEDAAAAMRGATLAVNADGVLIATVGGLRYALRPDWLSPDTVTQAAGFAAADGGLSYVKNLRAFVLHPACADFAQLAATVEEALPGATATTNADGTVTLALGEKRWTLAPEMALKAAPLGAGTWWAEADGRLWLRHADGTAQGFTVK